MPTVNLPIYVKDKEFSAFLKNKDEIREGVRNLIKNILGREDEFNKNTASKLGKETSSETKEEISV